MDCLSGCPHSGFVVVRKLSRRSQVTFTLLYDEHSLTSLLHCTACNTCSFKLFETRLRQMKETVAVRGGTQLYMNDVANNEYKFHTYYISYQNMVWFRYAQSSYLLFVFTSSITDQFIMISRVFVLHVLRFCSVLFYQPSTRQAISK